MDEKIAFIGAGNMAKALIGGMLESGFRPENIIATAKSYKTLETLVAQYPVQISQNNLEAAADSTTVIFAVKPQVLRAVLKEVEVVIGKQRPLLISIVAGANEMLFKGFADLPIILAMPNTPAIIGKGVTAILVSHNVSQVARKKAQCLFSSVGDVCFVDNEQQLHGATATSGSGPGYYFLLFEKLSRFLQEDFLDDFIAAINQWTPQGRGADPVIFQKILNAHYAAALSLGLNAQQAEPLVRYTALGSCYLALANDCNFTQLREKVTSKDGTTAHGLRALNTDLLETALQSEGTGQLDKLFKKALEAAYKRATELAALLSQS